MNNNSYLEFLQGLLLSSSTKKTIFQFSAMVLENRRGSSVQLDCIVYVQEIKPWPPSHSLRSIRSVFLQWKYIDGISGCTRTVIPSLGSGVGDGKLKFNESFKLPVSLSRETSEDTAAVSRNNYLEFSLYEPHTEKSVKDHLVGTVIVELENLKKVISVKAPMNFKRGLRATAQPACLFIKIQPINKHSAYSSSKNSLSKEASFKEEEYLEDNENPSFTDDDVSTHSSLTVYSATEATHGLPRQECSSEEVTGSAGRDDRTKSLCQEPEPPRSDVKKVPVAGELINEKPSHPPLVYLSSKVATLENDHVSSLFENDQEENSRSVIRKFEPLGIQVSPRNICSEEAEVDLISHNTRRSLNRADLVRQVHEKIVKGRNRFKENSQQFGWSSNNSFLTEVTSSDIDLQAAEKTGLLKLTDPDVIGNSKAWGQSFHAPENHQRSFATKAAPKEREDGWRLDEKGKEEESRRENLSKEDAIRKSVQSLLDSKVNGSIRSIPSMEDIKEIDVVDASTSAKKFGNSEKKRALDNKNKCSDGKIRELECKIEKFERELRDAAAVEISLYSVVAEHGSSPNKLYAPARRLSRLYLHACKHGSAASRASSAKSIASGIVLVTKACANDVPRLIFWLSNSVLLRVCISAADGKLQRQVSLAVHIEAGSRRSSDKKSSSLRKVSPSRHTFADSFDNWEDPKTFISALEKIEAWIFSQIIESLWWQIFTPHMQSTAEKANRHDIKVSRRKKNYKSNNPGLADQEQANFSLELWKKAFVDAREQLCPVRAAGHDCACLQVLARLTMEQCVGRLDVAIFNALLRETTDEIPTDPVSDPIINSKVLPISAGKSSFGAGAQLKNVVGNWSRWLADLFDTLESNCNVDERHQVAESFNFHLLNQLSDLMMLPKDMLLSKSCREEVCPTFSATLIQRVLNNFVPDEYCSDLIPKAVSDSLDSEEDKECIKYSPCNAAPVKYSPPSAASLAEILLDVESELMRRSKSSFLLRKSCTSDDELDEVDSPLSSFTFNKFRVSSPHRRGGDSVRYQLLREVWRDEDY